MSHDPKLAPHAEAHPDAWHRHTKEEGAPQVEHGAKADPIMLTGVIAVMVVIFLATCVVIVMYFNKTMAETRNRLLETTALADGPDGSFARHENALKNAEAFTWVDRETGVVTIPLSDATRAVIEDYQRNARGN